MKKQIISLVAISVIALFSNTVMAAPPLDANQKQTNATLNVVEVITLTQDADLNFGYITTGSTGTLTLDPETEDRTGTGGMLLLDGEASHVASYTVEGAANCGYAVTYPNEFTITNSAATHDVLTVTPSIFIPSNGTLDDNTGVLDGSGDGDFVIGGSISFATAAVAGEYNGYFIIAVNYN